ncbi:MAG: Rap1a/Tai family immunity protein [Pseudomonadota bacterium]
MAPSKPVRSAWFGLLLALSGAAGAAETGQNGAALLQMCRGGDKVRVLSVMCHSYANGFIEATHYHAAQGAKTGKAFCLSEAEHARLPGEIVTWLQAHPEQAKEPAAAVLHRVLVNRFPCKKAP